MLDANLTLIPDTSQKFKAPSPPDAKELTSHQSITGLGYEKG
jgi:hypothetical protein